MALVREKKKGNMLAKIYWFRNHRCIIFMAVTIDEILISPVFDALIKFFKNKILVIC